MEGTSSSALGTMPVHGGELRALDALLTVKRSGWSPYAVA